MADIFTSLPRGHFKALVVDPPWSFRSYTALQESNWTSRRDAEKHYAILEFKDIASLPVGDLAARDAHLFLWVTGPCLPQAFGVMEAWGFKFSSVAFVWIKLKRSFNAHQLRSLPTCEHDLHVGLGLTTRHNAEFCLLGRRGNARRISKSVREVIMSPVREHSRKPDEAYERVRDYCDGPYADIFSRSVRDGWTCWGHQKGLFNGR